MAWIHCGKGTGNQFITIEDMAVVQMLASTNDSTMKMQHYQPVAQGASGATTTTENMEIMSEEFHPGTMSHMARVTPIITDGAVVGDGGHVDFSYHGDGTSRCFLVIGGQIRRDDSDYRFLFVI